MEPKKTCLTLAKGSGDETLISQGYGELGLGYEIDQAFLTRPSINV